MEQDNEKLERYLEEFRPRAVRELQVSQRARSLWPRRLAAAAVVVCCVGVGYWQTHRTRVVILHPKTQALVMTRIGLQDREKLDEFLFEQSRNVLPSFQDEKSTLRVLAKE
jgi:hypothetical protein